MTCGPGAITHALFTIPEGNAPSNHLLLCRHIASIARSLTGAHKHFIVICSPSFNNPAYWFPEHHGCKLSVLRANLPEEAIWTQDPLLVTGSAASGRKRLVLSAALKRWPAWIGALCTAAEICDLEVELADFPFSSGNMLQGIGNCLVGLDLIHRIARWMGASPDQATLTLRDMLGVQVIPIGANAVPAPEAPSWRGIGFQPLFHLDQFLTRTALVGKDGREVVFIGHPAKTREVLGDFGNEVTRRWANQCPMQVCEEQLREHFDVRRLPAMFVRGRLGSASLEERTYLLAFNNCVIDTGPAGNARVLLPSFHSDSFLYDTDAASRQALEDAAASAWREVGAEVRFSDGVEDLAYSSGGLHCMSKVLQRAASARQLSHGAA